MFQHETPPPPPPPVSVWKWRRTGADLGLARVVVVQDMEGVVGGHSAAQTGGVQVPLEAEQTPDPPGRDGPGRLGLRCGDTGPGTRQNLRALRLA